jgi:radical SAM protein with 4Fe4S-binding SPASM domain
MPFPYIRLASNILQSNFRRVAFPYKLTYALTYRCNYRCKTCNIWQRQPENELTLEEIGRFFKKSNQFSWIHLTGGEIFLRRDLLEVVRIMLDSCPQLLLLNFPTNGFLTERIVATVEGIVALRPPEIFITVSLDGDEALNDSIRGMPGGWKRQMETFRQIRKLPGVKAALGMTLSTYNIDRFESTFQAARQVCEDLTYDDFHINIFHTSYYYGNEESGLAPKEKEDLVQVVERYRNLRKRKLHPIAYLESAYLKRVESYLRTGRTPVSCHALRASCFMDPSGRIYPCGMYDRPVGSLRDHDFDLRPIWHSEKSRKLQQEIRDFRCPQCWTPCEAYQSLLGNLLHPRFRTAGPSHK